MGQSYQFLSERDWITEGSVWRPTVPITLRDEAGVVIPSSQMATLVMTIYDLMDPALPIVGGVAQTDIKNTRSCSLSTGGVLVVTLLPTDTIMLQPTRAYEMRRALIEFTWPSTPTKADAIELTFVIRNLARRPYVP